MPSEKLKRLITSEAHVCLDYRQVAARLRHLLPARLVSLRREYRRQSAARSLRQALTDDRYVEHIEELVEISGRALRARIQSDTHKMLFEARQTLRLLRIHLKRSAEGPLR